jgi:hypothetical protein
MFATVPRTTEEKSAYAQTIEQAYLDLSSEGFAVWIRMMVAKPSELSAGRGAVAKLLNYSEGRSNAILRELKFKQYIDLVAGPKPGLPTVVKLTKRCKLVGRSNFLRLSRIIGAQTFQSEPPEEPHWLDDLCSGLPLPVDCNEPMRGNGSTRKEEFFHIASGKRSGATVNAQALTERKQSMGGKKAHKTSDETELDDFYAGLTSDVGSGTFEQPSKKIARTDKVSTGKHREARAATKMLARVVKTAPEPENEEPGDVLQVTAPRSKPAHECVRGGSIDRSRKGLDLSKIPSREERRAKRSLERASLPEHPDVGLPIDWTRFDLNSKPLISFEVDDTERELMINIVNGDPKRMTANQRRSRRQLVEKLRGEFIRMYERYRRAALRANGAKSTLYSVLPEEQKYAERAAIACINRGVTPTQVFQYWNDNIGNFADSKMPVPPITFLSQPANIDTVAISMMSKSKHSALPPRSGKSKHKESSSHPLSDTSLLHPALRRTLMEKGFDMSQINDKYLVTVQAYALDVAHGGEELRFIPAAMRSMVGHAAKTIYKDVDPYDYL